MPGDDEHRYAVTGQYTVDVVAMKAFLTSDPLNHEEFYDVERGTIQQRDRRSDPDLKFASNIAGESIVGGKFTDASNKLGAEWSLKTGELFPSLNEIFDGIKEE